MLNNRSSLQGKGNRRDRLNIISAVLSYAARGVGKTDLMYKVGLSSAQLDRYLPVLVRSELLEVSNHDKRPLYRTTDKGKDFLDFFDALVRLLD